jgi:predicted transglutaminase-like cysteine proteinase
MVRGVASVVVLVAGLLGTASFGAAAPVSGAVEYGKTLPPIGYVKFCATNKLDCQKQNVSNDRIAMTPELWKELFQVNSSINEAIKPMSDMELYGQPEYWTYPIAAGDCEDYLLLKKRELQTKGVSPSNLLITVVLDEKGEGHAVLTVATTEGDFILDNRRNDILQSTDTGYTFLKRQSRKSPIEWVSLRKGKTIVKAVTAASQ